MGVQCIQEFQLIGLGWEWRGNKWEEGSKDDSDSQVYEMSNSMKNNSLY